MITLAIDASTYRGTVAVLRGRDVIATAESAMRGAHAEALMPAVARVLADAGLTVKEIDRVICGEGPGSFTSLRIAASIAKGICSGLRLPLFAASSLGLTLASARVNAGMYVVTLDALRDEWYAAGFSRADSGTVSQRTPVTLVAKSEIDGFAAATGGTVIGAARGDAEPHASGCVGLLDEIERAGPVDLARWEPAYGRLAEAQVKWEAAHGRALNA
ncbi:MAG: tRNA (adenosine(37)-N6)-threonylcarbamoyltransferase complex dimerization subunit type 1 TsaB [Gemmatimonadaceae bacterium]